MTGGGAGATQGLFEAQAPRPLADRLRPGDLSQVVGQDHLVGAMSYGRFGQVANAVS